MRLKRIVRALLIIGACWALLAADGPKQGLQVAKTEQLEYPSNGILRLENSIGELTVAAWDQPNMQITTVKSTQREYSVAEREKANGALDQVRISHERKGNEVVITTDFPRHPGRPPTPWGAGHAFDLSYDIKVPRNTRLIVHHDVGEVHVDELAGDIQVSALQGTITIRLPGNRQYSIDAKCDFGRITSDFSGKLTHRWWSMGHELVVRNATGAQKLALQLGYGDVMIMKAYAPIALKSLAPTE